jgi:hypothetical protein
VSPLILNGLVLSRATTASSANFSAILSMRSINLDFGSGAILARFFSVLSSITWSWMLNYDPDFLEW